MEAIISDKRGEFLRTRNMIQSEQHGLVVGAIRRDHPSYYAASVTKPSILTKKILLHVLH
jgi:hypothetical protein